MPASTPAPTPPPVDPFDPAGFRALGHRFVDLIADHLEHTAAPDGRVLDLPPPAERLASVPPLPVVGAPPTAEALLHRLLAESNRLHHPRYMGHQVCPPQPVLALFELANAVLNNGMAVYEMGPVQTAMELRAVRWMAGRLGLPDGADGVLTSGGSVGNLTALLAARQRHGGDAWQRGGDRFCVLVSEQAHYCIGRAVRILGWGDGGVVPVPVDDGFRMRADLVPDLCAAARARGREPIAVVASSCTTATGSFDPLPRLADACRALGLWLHVDGAHGASYALSPSVRERLRGIDRADSVVWDAHKLLQVPALVTGVLFRDGGAGAAAFAQQASYLFEQRAQDEWYNRGHRTLECTKRGLGVLLYAAVALLGEPALTASLEHGVALARHLAARVRDAADLELAVAPDCNIVCFRHRPDGVAAADLDAHNRRIRERLLRAGAFYVVQTALPQGLFLRVTLINPRTTPADVDAMLAAVRAAAREAS
ncbi:MAG: aspartate aminotransferase family protein [Planctomycetota bacterium]